MATPPAVSFGAHNRGVEVALNYGTINTEIRHPPEQPERPPKPFASIYFSRDPEFVNRGDILEQVAQRCSEAPGRVALVGFGGVGKSQLAIEYAYRVAEANPDSWVFWLHAETRERVEEGFRMIADLVKLPGRNQQKDMLQPVCNWLANERNGRWVMILDSADDDKVFYSVNEDDRNKRPLASYLPQSCNGSIIVTTRDGMLASKLTGGQRNLIQVGPMSEAEALTLLGRRLGPVSDADSTMASDLVRALDLVPLAINQATAFIHERRPRSSIPMYSAEFRKSEKEKAWLLEHDAGDLRRYEGASNSVLTTWKISFDHIRSRRSSAADLLSLMSFFCRQGIPEEPLKRPQRPIDGLLAAYPARGRERRPSSFLMMLESLFRYFWPKNIDGDGGLSSSATSGDNGRSRIPAEGTTDLETDHSFEDDMAMLRAFSLVTTNETGDLFEMHALVQFATRKWLKASGLEETFKVRRAAHLFESFPDSHDEGSDWSICQRLLPHIELLALENAPNDPLQEPVGILLYAAGSFACSAALLNVAERLALAAESVFAESLGSDDLMTANSLELLTFIFFQRGLYVEAEKRAIQCAQVRKKQLGLAHLSTLRALSALAAIYKRQGRLRQANDLTAKIHQAKGTLDEPERELISIYTGPTIPTQQGEEQIRQIMNAREVTLGPDHPDTLYIMNLLGGLLNRQGRLVEAEVILRRVLEGRKNTLGPHQRDTLDSMSNLAKTLDANGRLAEADEVQNLVVECLIAKFGSEHPLTLAQMDVLADIYLHRGNAAKAEQLLKQVIQGHGPDDSSNTVEVLGSMSTLCEIMLGQKRLDEALDLASRIADICKATYGPDHSRSLLWMGLLPKLQRWQLRLKEEGRADRDAAAG